MHLRGVLDKIMCRVFLITLKGLARVWFSKITTPNSIQTFKELSGNFFTHFIRKKRYKTSSASLLNIKQWEYESLRSYEARFNKEALLINEVDDKVLVTTFTNGLCSGEFLFFVYKNNPKKMTDMLYIATKCMNVEDTMIAWGEKMKKREKHDYPYLDRGRKWARTSDKREDKRSRSPSRRTTNFTLTKLLARASPHASKGQPSTQVAKQVEKWS